MKRESDINKLSSSIAYIESRLTEDLKIDELAAQSYFSKTHYQRLFYSIVGETVMDYVKKRRLRLALIELCDTKAPILEIALKYGYESHDGFTRAFKNHYGVTPSRYRRLNARQKEYYHGEAAKMKTISKEAAGRIKKDMLAISQMMGRSAQCVGGLAANIKKTGETHGRNGAALLICAVEIYRLFEKMEAVKASIESFTRREEMAYGIYGEIHSIMKSLDDINFQTRLLKFLSGVEMARMGPPSDDLVSIKNEFEKLEEANEKSTIVMLGIIKDMASLIRADIKNDAANMIKEAAGLLQNAADEGAIIISNAKNTADASKHGNGIMYIAKTISNRIEAIGPVIKTLNSYEDEIKKNDSENWPVVGLLNAYEDEIKKNDSESGSVVGLLNSYENDLKASDSEKTATAPDAALIAEIRSAIESVQEIAFSINIAAFNAAIETARSGGDGLFRESYEKIVEYAGHIHQSYTKCTELFDESVKLSKMLRNGGAERAIALTQKMVEDISFEGAILAAQLGLEAERKNDDVFRNLAACADEALRIIDAVKREKDIAKCKKAITEYHGVTSTHVKNLRAHAKTEGAGGVPFEYIASEYDSFIEKIKNGIECL